MNRATTHFHTEPCMHPVKRPFVLAIVIIATGLVAAGCGGSSGSSGSSGSGGNTAAGKKSFQTACGACHTLSDAKTNGAVGPNLDQLSPAKETVLAQIENGGGGMPSGLLTGKDAESVAAYVAANAGK